MGATMAQDALQTLGLSPYYVALLDSLQERIRSAQMRAVLSVNRELVLLYWQIGREILIQQDAQGWGAKVIDRGNQYHLEVGGQDFYLDLLFYHFRLCCFVVIDLKIGAFQPEDAGKMNFYLSAVDDLLEGEQDQPAIGLILCREKNRVIVEYALRDLSKPIGVSAYLLTRALPEGLKGSLPTIEDLDAELAGNHPLE
jgi:hypothetical protein